VAIDPSRWQVLLVSLIPANEEDMQRHDLSYYSFSLTMDMNLDSQSPRVPVAQGENSDYGVRVRYFLFLAVCQFPFVSRLWLL
jgi:hypothetical protein